MPRPVLWSRRGPVGGGVRKARFGIYCHLPRSALSCRHRLFSRVKGRE
jgi:hypothetical protein